MWLDRGVVERKLSVEREDALVRLLDDPSPVVREGLVEELTRLGDLGVSLLKRVVRDADNDLAGHAHQVLEVVAGPDPVEGFLRFIRSLQYELETGCLLLNRVIKPDLDIHAQRLQLDAVAQRCRELMMTDSSAWERCKVMNRVLFHEFGFRGNIEDYEDPQNSYIASVLRRRKGIPISLGILYILIGDRCGLQLEAISLPGRFMVGSFEDETPFFIDAFERGRFRTPEEIHAMLVHAKVPDPVKLMAPAPVGEVLCRCCRNLANHYMSKNNPHLAKTFASFVRAFEETYRRQAQS